MPKPSTSAPLEVVIRPLTRARIDDFAHVLAGSGSGRSCWDLWPRFTAGQQRERGLSGGESRRREALGRLAARRRAPGLLAYHEGEAVGWISIGPRPEYARIESSRATPRVDDIGVWVIPCMAVRPRQRGRGVATALIRAAVEYAARHGAPAVEAYPRADRKRVHDEWAFYGTEAMFRRVGFTLVRERIRGLPRNWTPRVTMRIATLSGAASRRDPSAKKNASRFAADRRARTASPAGDRRPPRQPLAAARRRDLPVPPLAAQTHFPTANP